MPFLKRLKYTTLIILFSQTIWIQNGFGLNLEQLQKANTLYRQGNFNKAVLVYKNLVTEGWESGHLYYNLGNAYIKIGKTGPAILNYLKASFFLPRNEDVEANLKFAVKNTEDMLDWESPESIWSVLFWIQDFTLREHIWLLVILNLLFWLFWGIGFVNKSHTLRIFRNLIAGIFLFVIISTALRWKYNSEWNYGVIMDPQVNVYSDIGEKQTTLFILHEGAIIFIKDETPQWVNIQLADGQKGWINKSSIGA